jgi:hypothetical protein
LSKPAWKYSNGAGEEWTVRQDENVNTDGNIVVQHKVVTRLTNTSYYAVLTPFEARTLAKALVQEANYQESFGALTDEQWEEVL